MKRIGFFGNCHTLALSWFFRRVHPEIENKWICPQRWSTAVWPRNLLWRGGENPKDHVIEENSGAEIDYIKSCDMFVHTPHPYENCLNTTVIKGLLPDHCNEVIMPSLIVKHDTNEVGAAVFKGEEAYKENFNVSFKNLVSDEKAQMLDENHPNSYLFLGMVNNVCEELGLPKLPEDQYQPFLDFGWPFDNSRWLRARKVKRGDNTYMDVR